jgi:outer membrane autotransporter protein
VLYPELDENREYSDSEWEALEAEAAKKGKVLLNQLSPGLYTTLPTILFNSANMQNTQIQQRLWTMRTRSVQPPLNSASIAPTSDGKTATVENKKVVLPQEDPEKKWVAFVDGNGMWSQAQTVNNLPSYKTYGGGVQIGASREIVDGLVVGPYVGYQGTKVDFTGNYGGGSSATHNSVRFGLLAEYQLGGWYNDLIVGGAYNSIDVNHGIDISGYGNNFRRMAKGTVSGGEFDLLYGTGYEFKAGNFTFGPATSFQYTYVNLGGTQETGAGVLNQKIGGQSTSSLLYTLGGQVSYDINITDSVRLQPMGSLAWQHEFLQNGYDLNASILGENYSYSTTNAGRDQFIAGVGFNLVFGNNVSAFAICNLINSDAKVFSQAVSGGINVKF